MIWRGKRSTSQVKGDVMGDRYSTERMFEAKRKAEAEKYHRKMMAKRFSNYEVPAPESIKHVNPWIKTIVSYDLNNI